MITVIIFVVAILFGVKIIWNIFTPFIMGGRSLRSTTEKQQGVSMAPLVEIVLLVILILLSLLGNGDAWFYHPGKVALLGIAIIIISYVLFFTLAISIGWLVARIKKIKS